MPTPDPVSWALTRRFCFLASEYVPFGVCLPLIFLLDPEAPLRKKVQLSENQAIESLTEYQATVSFSSHYAANESLKTIMNNRTYILYVLIAGITPLLVLFNSLYQKPGDICQKPFSLDKPFLEGELVMPPQWLTVVGLGRSNAGRESYQSISPLGNAQIVSKEGQFFLQLDATLIPPDQRSDLQVLLDMDRVPPARYVNHHRYLNLGMLKLPCGTQQYPIPERIDVEQFRSVAIWHHAGNETLGFAIL